MTPVWLNRTIVVLAACTFLQIVAGAISVSKQVPSGMPAGHILLGVLVGAGMIAAASGLYRHDRRPVVRRLGLVAVLALSAVAALGLLTDPFIGIIHACAAHSFLALTFLLAWFTTEAGQARPLDLPDGGWPTLRSLAWITPAVVLLQVAFGAAYRHKLFGVVPHIAWAFAVGIIVMMLATFVLTLAHARQSMRRTSIWLLVLVSVQILLGVAAFVLRLNSGGPADFWMLVTTVSHAATGSLVLGVSVLLAAGILRNVAAHPTAPSPELIPSGRPS